MKKFFVSQKLLEGACLVILAGMILLPIIFWSRIPDQIPGHYNGAGEIDRWGDKGELLLLPILGVLLYLVLAFACAVLWAFGRKGEVPQSASLWMAGVKLEVLGIFAVTEWHSISARPLGGWFLPVTMILLGVLMAGLCLSFIRFAIGQRKV